MEEIGIFVVFGQREILAEPELLDRYEACIMPNIENKIISALLWYGDRKGKGVGYHSRLVKNKSRLWTGNFGSHENLTVTAMRFKLHVAQIRLAQHQKAINAQCIILEGKEREIQSIFFQGEDLVFLVIELDIITGVVYIGVTAVFQLQGIIFVLSPDVFLLENNVVVNMGENQCQCTAEFVDFLVRKQALGNGGLLEPPLQIISQQILDISGEKTISTHAEFNGFLLKVFYSIQPPFSSGSGLLGSGLRNCAAADLVAAGGDNA